MSGAWRRPPPTDSGWHRAWGNMKGLQSQNEGKGFPGLGNKMLAASRLVPPAAVLLHLFSLNTFFQPWRLRAKCCHFHNRGEPLLELGRPSRGASHEDLPQTVPHDKSQGPSMGTGSSWSGAGMRPGCG